MNHSPKRTIGIAVLAGFALICFEPSMSWAHLPDPSGGGGAAQCSKYKKGSKQWKECMAQRSEDREDAYTLGYWLAKTGEYQEAIKLLQRAGGESDPRVLTMIGYATRHLGRIGEAMGYYDKALALNPYMTNTRQYMGEAFLQKGEPQHAREQLAEIGARCGQGCEDYRSLAQEIATYENGASKG